MSDADIRRCAYLVVGRYLSAGNRKTLQKLIVEARPAPTMDAELAVLEAVIRIRDAMLAAGAVRDG